MTTKKLMRVTLAAMLAIAVLLAVLYTAAEADHDCSGDRCFICAMISACESTLKSLFAVTAVTISVILKHRSTACGEDRGEILSAESPVALKSKLLN